jgi:hypothetical protein
MPKIHSVPPFNNDAVYSDRETQIINSLNKPPIVIVNDNNTIQINKLTSWFTQDLWETIFPYSKASAVFTHDNEPFWTYTDFIQSIIWMNNHPDPKYHGFGTANSNNEINKYEIAAFLGNGHQETGEPSIEAPFNWYWPKLEKRGEVWEGFAGGLLGILEGAVAEIYFGDTPPFTGQLVSKPLKLSPIEKRVLGVKEDTIGGIIRNLEPLNQKQFGLPNSGVVFQDGLVGVSHDGTLYGDKPINTIVGDVLPSNNVIRGDLNNPKYNNLSPVSQYGGRGMIMLSYNYNYSECSISLFGDYRLVKYPNLIITTDRNNFNNLPFYFGFPGPNINGNNPLPEWIKNSTPSARQLAYITCLWFWMDNNRSGRKISCHECMQEPERIGITGTNLIINNQDGLTAGTWAANKNEYYRRICKIFNLQNFERTIVRPPRELYLRN